MMNGWIGTVLNAQKVNDNTLCCCCKQYSIKTGLPVQSCGASTITAVKKVHVGNLTAMSHQHRSLRVAGTRFFTLKQTII